MPSGTGMSGLIRKFPGEDFGDVAIAGNRHAVGLNGVLLQKRVLGPFVHLSPFSRGLTQFFPEYRF